MLHTLGMSVVYKNNTQTQVATSLDHRNINCIILQGSVSVTQSSDRDARSHNVQPSSPAPPKASFRPSKFCVSGINVTRSSGQHCCLSVVLSETKHTVWTLSSVLPSRPCAQIVNITYISLFEASRLEGGWYRNPTWNLLTQAFPEDLGSTCRRLRCRSLLTPLI